MKKLFLAFAMFAILIVSCSKKQNIAKTAIIENIKKTRAEKPKCDRDYIVTIDPVTGKSSFKCPKGGNLCYRDKTGNHGCGEYAASKSIVENYTDKDGTIKSREYFMTEDYTVLFPDVSNSYYSEITRGEIHLYLMPWQDVTPEETCSCPATTYVLSSAPTVDLVSRTNVKLIWAY